MSSTYLAICSRFADAGENERSIRRKVNTPERSDAVGLRMRYRRHFRQVDSRACGRISRHHLVFPSLLSVADVEGDAPGGGPPCLFQIRAGTTRCVAGPMLPVVFATPEVEFQALTVGRREALAINFAEQGVEVGQTAYRRAARSGP